MMAQYKVLRDFQHSETGHLVAGTVIEMAPELADWVNRNLSTHDVLVAVEQERDVQAAPQDRMVKGGERRQEEGRGTQEEITRATFKAIRDRGKT